MAKLTKLDYQYIKYITGGYIGNCLENPEGNETELKEIGSIKYAQEEERNETPKSTDENGDLVRVDENGKIQIVGEYTYSIEPPMEYKRDQKYLEHKRRFWGPSDWELEKDEKRTWSDAWCRLQDKILAELEKEAKDEDKERQTNKMLGTI